MEKNKKIAITGVISAMSITVLMMTTIFPFATYALPGIAGLLFAILVIEIDTKWAFACFCSTSLVSAFLVPDKEAVIMFIFLLGYYPIVKSKIERISIFIVRLLLKILLFNSSVFLGYSIFIFIIQSPLFLREMDGMTAGILAGILLMGNVTFLLYDYALSRLIAVYYFKYKHYLFRT